MLRKEKRSMLVLASAILVMVLIGVLHGVCVEASEKIPVSSIVGTWTASSGSGTAKRSGTTYDIRLRAGSGNVTFSNISGDDSRGTLVINGGYQWDIYDGGTRIDTVSLITDGPETRTFNRIGDDNKFEIDNGYGWIAVVTLTSDSSGSVTETGTYYTYLGNFEVSATYQINKQGSGGGGGNRGGGSGGGGGGCDTGIGLGLILALGALAVFKRAKHKV